jgi:hypothetical protein
MRLLLIWDRIVCGFPQALSYNEKSFANRLRAQRWRVKRAAGMGQV